MKKNELENCPIWLLEANTKDEDVEIIDGKVIWNDGIWEDGIWNDGIWEGGIWEDGIWKDGTWNGGTWWGGTWKDGTWKDGIWKGGIWLDGASAIKSKYIPIHNNGKIKIGCKEKTIEEWDSFFNGTEEFDTKRETREFKMIHAHYLAVKTYIQFLAD